RLGDRLKTARRVKPGGEFVSHAFVLNEAVLPRRTDGLLIQALGVQLPSFDAGDLGADQRRAVSKILGAILRPSIDLLVVSDECLQVLGALLGRRKVALRCPRERVIENVFSRLEESLTCIDLRAELQ